MKFKILALITGCICMCCLPFIQRPVCAENSVNSVVKDTTVKSGSEKQSKNQGGNNVKNEKNREEKGRNEKNKTIWQKFKAGVRKIKKELIIGTVGISCFGLGLLVISPFLAIRPLTINELPPLGKVIYGGAEALLVGGVLVPIGCLISAGIKLHS